MRKGRASIQMVLNKYEDSINSSFFEVKQGGYWREFQREFHSFVQSLTELASSFLLFPCIYHSVSMNFILTMQ